MTRELALRLTIGPVLAAAVLGGLAIDLRTDRHWFLLVLGVLAIPLAWRELRHLAANVVGPVQVAPTLVVCYGLLLGGWAESDPDARNWLWMHARPLLRAPVEALLIAVGLGWTILIQMRRRAYEHFFTNVALTLFGMLYIGVTVNLVMHLAGLSGDQGDHGNPDRGTQLVVLFMTSCKLGDVTAFIGGRLFGRHKMAPRISPGKTWEGFAFSFVGAIGGAYGVTAVFSACCDHGPFNGWWQPAVWGLVLGPLGVVGDLAESCMKREAAAKDSGTLVPGFGGMLDLFDALVLAAPVAYLLALVL